MSQEIHRVATRETVVGGWIGPSNPNGFHAVILDPQFVVLRTKDLSINEKHVPESVFWTTMIEMQAKESSRLICLWKALFSALKLIFDKLLPNWSLHENIK
jgi:hypothetical protein